MAIRTITLAREVVERAHQQLVFAASAFKGAKPSHDELRVALASADVSAPGVPPELVHDLAGIAVGRIVHVFNGSCPDQVEGESARDDECPACRILLRVDALRTSGEL